jgi:hypothetical protein
MELKNTADLRTDHLRMLVVGPTGAGKTRFAATFPNPVFANCLGGMTSIADKGLRYVDVSSEAELLELKFAIEADDPRFRVDTLVIDTLDEFQRILLSERLVAEQRSETTPSDYGWLGQRMHTIIEGLSEMPVNLVVLCHPKEVTDGETGNLFIKPGLQGAFADQVGQYFDFALYLQSRHFRIGDHEWETEMGGEDGYLTQPDMRTEHYLVSHASRMMDWVKDLTGSLEPEMRLDFVTDYERVSVALSAPDDAAPQPAGDEDQLDGQISIYETLEQELAEKKRKF